MAHYVYKLKDGERINFHPSEVAAMQTHYRFLSHVRVADNGCWLWKAKLSHKGYGVFWDGFRNRPAHRWAYEHFVECQPAALVIDHLCRNRHCVNPDHLEPVIQQINVLRGEARAAYQARQTHCIHGHELIGRNLYRKPNGARQCITCRRKTDRKRYVAA